MHLAVGDQMKCVAHAMEHWIEKKWDWLKNRR